MQIIYSPVTNKVFNSSSHIVAIKTSGNVYSHSAVDELNLRPKHLFDLLDGSRFTKADIITLQDPQNPDIMAKRDISQFKHLQTVRDAAADTRRTESKVRHSTSTEAVMRELERRQQEEEEVGLDGVRKKKRTTEEIMNGSSSNNAVAEDVARFQALSPLVEDVNPGSTVTTGQASSALTSTSVTRVTLNAAKLASAEDIRLARWRMLRQLGKKAFVQLQTNYGNLNIELQADRAMMTCWSFVTLCQRGYYTDTVFHRLIPGFVLQGGDPTGTGTGGHSAFPEQRYFRDEFDDIRLIHDQRGVLSMANSGPNSNASQFFITFAPAPHLDRKHAVFGRVVGGMATLDRIENVRSLQ